MKTGQMFILTVVFLVGMVFALQQVFLQYAFFDLPGDAGRTSYPLLAAVATGLNRTVQQATTCEELATNMEEFTAVVEREVLSGFALELEAAADCTGFTQKDRAALSATITFRERDSEARKTVHIRKA